MSEHGKAAFFDGIADKWDGWEDLAALGAKLAAGLDTLGVGPHEHLLDVGCGTGNLTRALLSRLGADGRVTAIDISPRMLDEARHKVTDTRVEWRCEDARRLSFTDATFDRVICYSVWPHFEDKAAVAAELRRVLRPGALLHVWHLIARGKVNEIHAGAGEAVRRDTLAPGAETALLLERAGFAVSTVVDDDRRYLITAARKES